jgi:hypothetical protein
MKLRNLQQFIFDLIFISASMDSPSESTLLLRSVSDGFLFLLLPKKSIPAHALPSTMPPALL